jgi:glycerate 2-kinase
VKPLPQEQLLLQMFHAALAAADPRNLVARHLPAPPKGRLVVVGAGKAGASMAYAVEQNWRGPLSGKVVVPHGAGLPLSQIEVIEASHPVPDDAGTRAANGILQQVSGLTADDLVLALISGGGSALLSLPAPGISAEDKRALTRALLRSGANIREFNTVRKHLSAIKGGRLARAAQPARVVTLLISDVPGDDPAMVASGPTLPDTTTCVDALAVLDKYAVPLPGHIRAMLTSGELETPKPGDACFAGHEAVIIARAQDGLEAAAKVATEAGNHCVVLGNAIEGESREIAKMHAGIALQVARHGQPAPPPCVLLSGGETTVTIRGTGKGGRNGEFALALALALDSEPNVYAISAGTDGIDGTEHNAGAIVTPDTLSRAAALGIDPAKLLADNDSFSFFDPLGDLVVTGPTRTNINDFRALLIL